jgi:hypothetical protein
MENVIARKALMCLAFATSPRTKFSKYLYETHLWNQHSRRHAIEEPQICAIFCHPLPNETNNKCDHNRHDKSRHSENDFHKSLHIFYRFDSGTARSAALHLICGPDRIVNIDRYARLVHKAEASPFATAPSLAGDALASAEGLGQIGCASFTHKKNGPQGSISLRATSVARYYCEPDGAGAGVGVGVGVGVPQGGGEPHGGRRR